MKPHKHNREKVIEVLSSTIANCEKMQIKFQSGTSQHTLLKNRIKALTIAKVLLIDGETPNYPINELKEALPPVMSILHKTTKAQSKYEEGSTQYNRLDTLIQTMGMAKAAIEEKINKNDIL